MLTATIIRIISIIQYHDWLTICLDYNKMYIFIPLLSSQVNNMIFCQQRKKESSTEDPSNQNVLMVSVCNKDEVRANQFN